MQRPAAHGFTLIEVLVALAIVAVTLRLTEVSEAQWCADNQLTGLKLARQYPSVGDADFSCDQLGRTYVGKLVTRPTPNPNFRRVDAQIANGDGQPVLALSTVMSRY